MTMKAPTSPDQCVILVGGLGTRLGDLTGGRPKPLTLVAGRPFLDYILWHVRRMGFSKALLLAGHRAAQVQDYAASAADESLRVEVAVEPEPLGTGGALRFALDRLGDRFVLLNGDSLFDFNWVGLLSPPLAPGQARMALRFQPDATRYGVARLDGQRVVSFEDHGGPGGGLINGGVYGLTKAVAAGCPIKGSFEREVLPRLSAEGRLFGQVQRGFFLDIGVPEALVEAQAAVPESHRRGGVLVLLRSEAVLALAPGDQSPALGLARRIKAINDEGRFAFLYVEGAGASTGDQTAALAGALGRLASHLRLEGAFIDDVFFGLPAEAGDDALRMADLAGRLSRWPIRLEDLHPVRWPDPTG
jgi:D-glycero-D-manno-heptose 1,7-bisphosphate phosphatase